MTSVSTSANVRDVQNRVRSVDMTLFPAIKKTLGEKQTFVYSLLAGFCQFAGTDVSGETEDVQKYAAQVASVAEACFSDIDAYRNQLDNQELKGKLQDKLNTLLFYPEKTDFELIEDPKLIGMLQQVLKVGTYTLYKLPSDPEKYYGGRIDIDDPSFEAAAEALDRYRAAEDVIGSSFDHKGHISTIEPGELSKKYAEIVKAHEDFFAVSSKEVSIKPVGLKVGAPQSGRLSKVVTVVLEVDGLNKYRESLGLGNLKFPPHISVFSQEISPIPSLANKSILDFTHEPTNQFLLRLNKCFGESLSPQNVVNL
jgi:hypothetical protein